MGLRFKLIKYLLVFLKFETFKFLRLYIYTFIGYSLLFLLFLLSLFYWWPETWGCKFEFLGVLAIYFPYFSFKFLLTEFSSHRFKNLFIPAVGHQNICLLNLKEIRECIYFLKSVRAYRSIIPVPSVFDNRFDVLFYQFLFLSHKFFIGACSLWYINRFIFSF